MKLLMKLLYLIRFLTRLLDPQGARGMAALSAAGSVSFLGALLGGLGALSGVMGAREQNQANARAWEPRPYESNETRTPWEPAIPYLENLFPMASSIFANSLASPGPPSYGGGGPSQEYRGLVDAIQGQAMSSQFVPQAQQHLLGFMGGGNPLLSAVYERAMDYSNPYLDSLLQQGIGGGGLNQATPLFQNFLSGLLSGNESLGMPFMAPQLMNPRQRLAAAAQGKPMERI